MSDSQVCMLETLVAASKELLDDSDFWLLAALGDWSFEEINRPCHVRYLESWRGRLPEEMLCKARLGINEQLNNLIEKHLRSTGMATRRDEPYPGIKDRFDIAIDDRANGRSFHIEVKYVYDCASKFRLLVPTDSLKPVDYQVVFFATLPNYSYPPGSWYNKKKYKRRETKVVGIKKQYAKLCESFRPANWPSDAPYCVNLPCGTNVLTEDCIQSRFSDTSVFVPDSQDEKWTFKASVELKDAQIGFAIWDWSQNRRVR